VKAGWAMMAVMAGMLAGGVQAQESVDNDGVSAWVAPPLPQSFTRQGIEVAFVSLEGKARQDLKSIRGASTASLSKGQRYGLELTNHNPARIWLVVSIDGRNPSSGQRSYIAQPGLVLEPGKTVTLYRGRVKKKGELLPLFEQDEGGSVSVGVFHERRDYPFLTPGMTPPPGGPETFVQDADGQRWVPPVGSRFRKSTEVPAETIYLRYQRPE